MELTAKDKILLLKLARQSIMSGLGIPIQEKITEAQIPKPLTEPGAVFVTLTGSGELRGCIGSLEAYRPLYLDVQENALAAAFYDTRFPQVSKIELQLLRIEISVLGKQTKLTYKNTTDLLSQLESSKPGVVISRAGHHATFLPQVWEELPQVEYFLTELCRKAGLAGSAWQSGDLEVNTYPVLRFSEAV
jgi:AmmeMemoRadiSam system protein A